MVFIFDVFFFFHERYIICLPKAHNVLHKRTTRVTVIEQAGFIVHQREEEGSCGEILSEQNSMEKNSLQNWTLVM